jgi:hypothetical protein
MTICGTCGKEVRVRFINFEADPKDRRWECADCAGIPKDSPMAKTAEKIAKAEADGTLKDYKLSERLENLAGRKVQ